ncbi:MAG: hypothetical protein J6I65_03665 [Lachnospiraceae bacterium]|nr:hypothetical protein [Lachnospiraceae bacterium]
MALKEKQRQKWEEVLKELNLMEANDTVEDAVMANNREMMSWYKGNLIFTKERIVFYSGALGTSTFSIKYSDIRTIGKCMVSGFVPMGIKLEVFDPEKNKEVNHRISVSKRNKWIELLTSKSGVACS